MKMIIRILVKLVAWATLVFVSFITGMYAMFAACYCDKKILDEFVEACQHEEE